MAIRRDERRSKRQCVGAGLCILQPTALATLFVALLVSGGGCSDGRSSVSGAVTLDGQPFAKTDSRTVTIMFAPESGSGTSASALVDESGYYSLSTGAKAGLPPGKYIVTLAAVEASPSGKRVVSPERYTNAKQSDLRADVAPGNNELNFELTSTPGG